MEGILDERLISALQMLTSRCSAQLRLIDFQLGRQNGILTHKAELKVHEALCRRLKGVIFFDTFS
jgi:hypothetical protein